MVRTTISAFLLVTCLAAQAADHGRALRLSDLPIGAQNHILETVMQDRSWTQLGELTASDATTSDYFGLAVAIDGDTVVVGATGAQVGSNANQGAGYVFVKPTSGWQNMRQVAKLTASDGKTGDRLGVSVAVSGNFIVVGGSTGGYLFRKPKRGWKSGHETAKLGCGPLVAISGDTVVCGGFGAAVYVKPKTGWRSVTTYDALLEATDPGTFFFALAIDRGVVVAGNYEYNNSQGAAYVFVKPKRGWNVSSNVRRIQFQTARLTASDGVFSDRFGWSAAIRGDAVAVGAPQHNPYGCHCGAAYVFVKPVGGWKDMTQTAELTDTNLQYASDIGSSAAVQGRTLVAGAVDGGNADFQGSAFIFIEPPGGWVDTTTPDATLMASDGQQGDHFGVSAGISGNTILIGSARAFVNLTGAAYVFGP